MKQTPLQRAIDALYREANKHQPGIRKDQVNRCIDICHLYLEYEEEHDFDQYVEGFKDALKINKNEQEKTVREHQLVNY